MQPAEDAAKSRRRKPRRRSGSDDEDHDPRVAQASGLSPQDRRSAASHAPLALPNPLRHPQAAGHGVQPLPHLDQAVTHDGAQPLPHLGRDRRRKDLIQLIADGPGALEPVFPPSTFGLEPVRLIEGAPADGEDEWAKEKAGPTFVAQALPPWLRVRWRLSEPR